MSMYFRLYVRDAKLMLNNLKLNPDVMLNQFKNVKLYVILKNPEVDVLELPEIFSLAAEINMEVIVGFRLMETKPASGLGWLDSERWSRNASYLNLVVNSVAAITTTTSKFKIALDIEDYAGSMPIPTIDQMLIATSQFTTAIKALRITPCVYPAETAPEVLDPIITCVNNDAELWTEIGFPLTRFLRSNSTIATANKAKLFQLEHDLKARWPGVKVIHGSNDDIIRDFTLPTVRDALIKDVGFGWMFDSIRIDNSKIGTPEWCAGLTASTTNDVKHCFFAEPNSISFLKGWPSGASYGIVQAVASVPPIRSDLRSSAGALLTNGLAFRHEIMQRDAREGAVAVNFQLPVGSLSGGPIFGASQANSESWQLTYDQQLDSIVFDVYQVAVIGQLGTRLRTTIMEHPLKGTPIKLVASLKDGAWSIIGTGMPSPIVVPVIRSTVGAGHIWIGAGTNCDGSRKTIVFDNLVALSVESWHRALSSVELPLALASWPRVK